MNAQQAAPLPGYAQTFGTKDVVVIELAGPVLYAAGGQTIDAAQFGKGGFDFISCGQGLSYSGTYFARVQYLPIDAAPSLQNQSVKTAKILWYVLATGAEAGAIDLSTEILRLMVFFS